MKNQEKQLSEAQLNVMKVIWEQGPCSVSDVMKGVEDQSYARTTVATMLTRLESQGWIVSEKVDGKNMYKAQVEQQQVQSRTLTSLLKNFFMNRKTQLVSHLLDDDKVTPEELDDVIAMLEKKKRELAKK